MVLAAALAQHGRAVRDRGLAVAHDPQVLERRAAAHELLVDRARAVGVLPAEEAGVDDRVAQRTRLGSASYAVAPQPALVERAALVVVEVARDGEHGAVVGADRERERLVADDCAQRQPAPQLAGDRDRPRRAQLPRALGERERAGERGHRGGRHRRAPAVERERVRAPRSACRSSSASPSASSRVSSSVPSSRSCASVSRGRGSPSSSVAPLRPAASATSRASARQRASSTSSPSVTGVRRPCSATCSAHTL